MITYVNTVFVSNANSGTLATSVTSGTEGQFIVWDIDQNKVADSTTSRFKIGMYDGGTSKQVNPSTGATNDIPSIKWSNIINVADIKGWAQKNDPGTNQVSEDTIVIDFTSMSNDVLAILAQGGKRIITRLTFKDLPTRFRKWTESYEYVTESMDITAANGSIDTTKVTAAKTKIASDIANLINKQWKRARVIATAAAGVLTLAAMPYDDDNSADSINWANKVRFNANVYYTNPSAEGWESLNKNYPTGVTITKTPGQTFIGNGKLVRDREAQAMGYLGILNHGEGTWPIIQPKMQADINANYNVLTIEFENMYRTADDLFRKTKQTVEIYAKSATAISNIVKILEGGEDENHNPIAGMSTHIDKTIE